MRETALCSIVTYLIFCALAVNETKRILNLVRPSQATRKQRNHEPHYFNRSYFSTACGVDY